MFAAIAAAAAGVASTVANTYLQWKNQKYQKDLQQDIFAREDTSIQRRVADLKAAGLSPVLAAGQGAGTGAVVSTQAPQVQDPVSQAIGVMSLLKMQQDISMTDVQKQLVQQQTEKAKADTTASLIDGYIKNHDYQIFKKSGTASNAGGVVKTVRDILSMAESPLVKQESQRIVNKVQSGLSDWSDIFSGKKTFGQAVEERKQEILRQQKKGGR